MTSESGRGLDGRELEALYVRLEKPLYTVVYRWLWQAEEAQDVVQDAFVRLWRMRGRVDPQSVEPLLYKIALNQAANRRRARKVWQWVSLEAIREQPMKGADAEGNLADAERRELIRRTIDGLPEGLRRVVLLCEFSEMSYEQVARALSIPPGTVGSRRNKAMKLLRERLATLRTEEVEHVDLAE